MDILEHLKSFFVSNTSEALIAVLLVAIWRLWAKYDKVRDQQVEMNKQYAVLADKMCRTIRRVAAFAERWTD